jgi:hypothetical protein
VVIKITLNKEEEGFLSLLQRSNTSEQASLAHLLEGVAQVELMLNISKDRLMRFVRELS